jgi:dUTP pyrophosphatase
MLVQPIRFKRLPHGEGLPLPAYATDGAAAMDICAAEDLAIKLGDRAMVRTGFAVAVPEGYELQCRPRSGLAFKRGITITNSPGTIDSDYRGEICVILHNLDKPLNFGGTFLNRDFEVKRGDRIAQLVLAPVTQGFPVEVDELDETTRGTGGFGSTGRN